MTEDSEFYRSPFLSGGKSKCIYCYNRPKVEKKTYNDFVVGYKGSFTRKVTERDNDLFAELSGDHNPLHFSEDVAREVGFEGRVSNGFVTESRLAAALVETFTSHNTIVLELEKNTRFRKPVYMDDSASHWRFYAFDRFAGTRIGRVYSMQSCL